MKRRVFIVHGWDGHPQEGWFPWLKRELESRGFEVHVPQLPDPGTPRINTWVPALAQAVGISDEQTFFVGHSMGCQTIARYVDTLPEHTSVGGAVFVAGFFKRLTNMEDDEVQAIAKPWLKTVIDFKKVKQKIKRCIAIFSDDDPYVPLDNKEDFETKLSAKIIIEHKMNHFSGSQGIMQVLSVLKSILEITRT